MTITMDILTHLEQVLICLDKLDHTTLLHPINWSDALKKTVSDREYGIPIIKLPIRDNKWPSIDKLNLLNALKLRLITLPSSYLIPQNALDAANNFQEEEPRAIIDMEDEVSICLKGDKNEMKSNIPITEIEGYLETLFIRVSQFQEENTIWKCDCLLETVWPNFGKKERFYDFDINPDTGVCEWPNLIEAGKRMNFLKSHLNELEDFLYDIFPEFKPGTAYIKRKENPRWGYNPTKGRIIAGNMTLASKIDDDFYRRCSVVFEFKKCSIGEKIEKFLHDRELMICKIDESDTYKSIFYQLILQLLVYDTDSGFLSDARRFFFWKLADVDESEEKEAVQFDFIYMDSWFIDINDQTVLTPWLVFLFCYLRDIDPSLNDQRKRNFQHFVDSVTANSTEDDTNMDESDDDEEVNDFEEFLRTFETLGFSEDTMLELPLPLHDVKIVTKPSVLEPAEVMDSNYFTKVMIFDTPYFQMKFRKYFEGVDIRSSKVVLKIYDKVKIESSHIEEDGWLIGKQGYEIEEFVKHVLDLNFGNELKVLERIELNNGRHGEVRIKANKLIATGEIISKERVTSPEGDFSTYDLQYLGSFLLLEYVPSDFNNITDETISEGIRQLRELANIGVYNRDINLDNMRFPSTGTVTFIDFSHCELFKPTTKLVEKYSARMVKRFTQSFEEKI